MLGFIKKDLLMIRSNLKVVVILFAVYGLMAYNGQTDLSFMLPFLSVMVMISTFSYDTYNKWDAYATTLPNGRKNSVRAKYLATLIVIALTAIFTIVLSFFVSYASSKTIDYEYILMTMAGCLFATVLLESLMYPANYYFGVEKARIGIFIVVFGIAIIGGIVAKYVDFSFVFKALESVGDYWIIVLPITMILMLFISYKISETIYLKKEF